MHPRARMTPELELLRLAAHPAPEPAPERLQALIAAQAAAPALLLAARAHGLGPLLARLVGRLEPEAQPAWLAPLRDVLRATTAQALLAARDARAAVGWLEAAGLPTRVVKGPALTAWLYQPGLRPSCDVDLLVRPADVHLAREALLAGGYRQVGGPPPEHLSRYLHVGSELLLAAPRRTPIDLHWRLADPGFPLDLGERPWQRSRTVDLGSAGVEASVETLDPTALLLYLCHHGGKHLWGRLLWLADVGRLVTREAIDWDDLAALAARTRTRRLLAAGLLLTRDVLDLDLPAGAAPTLAVEGAPALAGAFRRSLERGGALRPAERHRLLLRAREAKRDRLAYGLDVVLRPTEFEWDALSLPGRLFGVYSIYRVGRLAKKYAGWSRARPGGRLEDG